MYSNEKLFSFLEEFKSLPSETEWLEFKEAKTSYDFDDLGKYLSALSNEANLKGKRSGWLIFGIKDKSPRDIVGTQYRQDRSSLDSLKQEVSQHTNGVTFQEIYELNLPEGRVIMFQIPAAPAGIPTSWKGHYFGRNGESRVPLSMQEIETIRRAAHHDWSAGSCPGATINDLEENALELAWSKFHAKNKSSRLSKDIDSWDLPTFLEKINLTRNGIITRSAILLLGKPESAHYVNPNPAQITWKLDAEETAYQHFGPPFLLNVEEIFRRIRNITFRIQPFNQLIPIELTKYDPKIVLEALNNCIAHQDYSQNARIIVTEKTDRLILQNAGNFYDGTVEDYVLMERTPLRYRNPLLAQAMVKLDMIDTMGMGIRRMFLEQRRRFFPMPEYNLQDPNSVVMTIYGKIIDENYSRVLMEEENLQLPDVILLDKVQKKQLIDLNASQLLRKRKLIEGRYPNIYISAKIAKKTGQQVEYTKHRAFNNQYYKDFILEFLKQHNEATPEEIQSLLIDKPSDILTEKQRKAKIRNLLQEMSQEGMIDNIGGRGLRGKWRLIV